MEMEVRRLVDLADCHHLAHLGVAVAKRPPGGEPGGI
jgi:hypothetical protein